MLENDAVAPDNGQLQPRPWAGEGAKTLFGRTTWGAGGVRSLWRSSRVEDGGDIDTAATVGTGGGMEGSRISEGELAASGSLGEAGNTGGAGEASCISCLLLISCTCASLKLEGQTMCLCGVAPSPEYAPQECH